MGGFVWEIRWEIVCCMGGNCMGDSVGEEPSHVRLIKSTPHSSVYVSECAAPDRREKSR